MSSIKFKRGESANLNNVPIEDGSILFTEDTARMYLDANGERQEIHGDVREQVESHNFGENNTLNVGTIGAFGNNNVLGCKAYRILKYKVDTTNNKTYVQVDGNEEISTIPAGTPVTLIFDQTATRLDNTVDVISYVENATEIIINKAWVETNYTNTNVTSDWVDVITGEDYDNLLIFPTYPSIGTTAYGENTFAGGDGNKALMLHSVALGKDNSSEGKYSVALGRENIAGGYAATTAGRNNQALGNYSLAIGQGNKATNLHSIALGWTNTASGYSAIAEGQGTTASGAYSHSTGLRTEASGQSSHAEGDGTCAKGNASYAGGFKTIVEGDYSHAGGNHNTVKGESSVAYGQSNTIEKAATKSIATGLNNKITAGSNIYVGGQDSEVSRANNIAHGNGLLAKNHYAKAVFGSYNEDLSDTHLEVGIAYVGTKDANGNQLRRNGFTVHHDGHAEVFKMGTTDKSVATKKYVDTEIADLVDSAPENLNTLKELADALNDQEDVAAEIVNTLANKVDKVEGKSLSTNDFTNAYKNQLDNEIVGEFTVDGSDYVDNGYEEIRGELFNDYDDVDGNKALAPGSHAEGTRSIIVDIDTSTTIPTVRTSTMQNIAGCMCYEIHSGTLGSLYYNPSITINDDRSGVVSLKGHIMSDTSTHGSGPLEVGDVVSLIVEGNADDCGVITAIEETTTGLLRTKVTNISVDYLPERIKTGLTVYSVLPFILKVNDKPFTGTKALGLGAHTEGVGNQALSDGAHAEGRENKAVGRWSHAEGWKNIAHYASHAEGWETQAKGIASHAEGRQTISAMHSSHAEGYMTQAIADQTHAEGLETIAAANCSHAEGTHSQASGYASHTEGYYTSVRDISGETLLDGDDAYVVPADHGTTKWGSGSGAHAEGQNTVASSNGAHAEGNLTYAVGSCCHAEGHKTIADGYQSHSEGYKTKAVGNYAHSEGTRTEASGIASHAEGNYNKATGESSHAQGQKTTASGKHSHAEGYSTTACGGQSHAEGDGTIAEGTGSHAEGYKTSAIGNQSHAEGNGAIAEGTNAHAEGRATKATKHACHAEGSWTQAIGDQSHSEGLYTIASGTRAHAEGWSTEAKAGSSHASGIATVAGYVGQTVVGIANENKADNLFEVGNGSYNVENDKAVATTRSNAFEVKKTGVAIAGGKTLATEQYVQQEIAKMVDSAPETLNTLNELADALGNDPNFATTVATEIGKKVDKVEGKGLSTNDFTNEYKNMLDNGVVTSGGNIPMEIVASDTQPTPVEGKTIIWIDISALS